MKSINFLLIKLLIFFCITSTDLISVAAQGSDSILSGNDGIENEILTELNLARTNPLAYSKVLEEYKLKQNNISKKNPELEKSIDEAIRTMRTSKPIQPLSISIGITKAAKDHQEDLSQNGGKGHIGTDKSSPFDRMNRYGKWKTMAGENISFKSITPREVVLELIIDEGVPGKGRRLNVLNSNYNICGIACGKHKTYKNICIINFAGGYIENP